MGKFGADVTAESPTPHPPLLPSRRWGLSTSGRGEPFRGVILGTDERAQFHSKAGKILSKHVLDEHKRADRCYGGNVFAGGISAINRTGDGCRVAHDVPAVDLDPPDSLTHLHRHRSAPRWCIVTRFYYGAGRPACHPTPTVLPPTVWYSIGFLVYGRKNRIFEKFEVVIKSFSNLKSSIFVGRWGQPGGIPGGTRRLPVRSSSSDAAG